MKAINRAVPFSDYKSDISEQKTADSPKLINKPIKKEAMPEDGDEQALCSLNIFGMTIKGLDFGLINNVLLHVEVPLQHGSEKKFLGVNKKAKIRVNKGTNAFITLQIFRNKEGNLAIKNLSLKFSDPITIRNPATSLQKNDGCYEKIGASVKDKIAHVKLESVLLDEFGQVFVNGQIKTLHLIKHRLPKNITHVDPPTLDYTFLESMGLIERHQEQGEEKFKSAFSGLDIKQILVHLGAITKEAKYSLRITGEKSHMSFLKNTTCLKGPKRPIDINLHGRINISKAGDVFIQVGGDESVVSCSLGTFVPDIKASIRHVGEEKPAEVTVEAHVVGSAFDLYGETFSKEKGTLSKKRKPLSDEYDVQTGSQEQALIGAKRIDLDATVHAQARIKSEILKASGQVSIEIKAHDPYAKKLERGISMDGYVSAYVTMDDFSYKKGHGLEKAHGRVGFGIHPSETTLKAYPELKSVHYAYELSLAPDGKARVTPPDYGITRFVRPISNFEGHIERIDGPLTHGPLFPIGSPAYFEHVEKITGAKLRDATKLKLLVDGISSMPERLKLINEASDYICFQTLVFKDDVSGWTYAKALVDAAKRGVRIYGIVDSLGNVESLNSLKNPNPIYEYLRENGVNLMVYNSFLENGLRELFRIVKRYPDEFQVETPDSLANVIELSRFLKRVIYVAESKTSVLSLDEKFELKNAIHILLDGKEGVSPEIAMSELKEVLESNNTSLEGLLFLIKRSGKASFRWHEKYLISDHKIAIVGGMNIADEYMRGGTGEMVTIRGKTQPAWRDTDVLLEGDIVSDIYRSFRRNWLHVAQERLEYGPKVESKVHINEPGRYAVSMMQHRPLEDGDHKVLNFLLYNLRTLKPGEKAWFETAYFLPRGILRALQTELVNAAKRGVDVRILTNSATTSDCSALVDASVFDLRELLEASARVYVRSKDRMVHAKVMALGDTLTMIGSWNCDNRSATHDSEDICLIYDTKVNQDMASILLKDMFDESVPLTINDVQNRTLGQEIKSAGMLLVGELV